MYLTLVHPEVKKSPQTIEISRLNRLTYIQGGYTKFVAGLCYYLHLFHVLYNDIHNATSLYSIHQLTSSFNYKAL